MFIDDTPKIRGGLDMVQGLSPDADGDRFRFFVDNLDFCFSYSLNVKKVKWLLFKRVKSVKTTLTE